MDPSQNDELEPNPNEVVQDILSRKWWPEAALFVLALATFAMSFGFGFAYDDRATLLNGPSAPTWSVVSNCFTTNLATMHGSNLYRPVSCSWLRVSKLAFDTNFSAWHAASILLHAICTALVFVFAKKVLRSASLAFVAGALFAVHPVHVEAVSWISAMSDPVMAAFVLASAIMWLRWAEGGGAGWWTGAFLSGAAAILSKESAVLLPLLLAITGFAVERDQRRCWKLLVVGVVPLAIVDVVYLIVRQNILHGFVHGPATNTNAEMIYTLPSVGVFYVRQLVVPMKLGLFYPLGFVPTWKSAAFMLPLCGLLAIVAAIVWLVLRSEQRAQLWVALAWTVLPLAPMLYIKAFMSFDLVHDRYLYIPSVGYCMIAAVGLAGLCRLFKVESEPVKLGVASIAITLLLLCTVINEPVYRNDISAFTRAVELVSKYEPAVLDLGVAYLEQRDYDIGIPLIERAIALRPTDAAANFNRGRAAWELGDNVTAEQYISRALRLDMKPEYLIQFVSVEMRLGRLDNAEGAAREALRIDPGVANGHLALGAILLEKGDRAGAAAEFRQQLRLDPGNRGAQIGLQRAGER